MAAQVLVPVVLGLVLIVAFVPWALAKRNIHPLVDLRLFENRNMTVAVIAMSLFAIAFFGASLLFPLYFQQVRGETRARRRLLLAPQGIGAMITMPIAGVLADRIGPGKIVLTGIAVITVGMGMFTQLDRGHVVHLHHRRAVRDGPRHGRHDDADHGVRAGDPDRPQHRPRLDADEHRPAGGGLDRHRAVLGAAHQRAQGQRRHRQAPSVADVGDDPSQVAALPSSSASPDPLGAPRSGHRRWPTRSRRSSSSPRSWSPACLIPAALLPRKKVAPVDPTALVGH